MTALAWLVIAVAMKTAWIWLPTVAIFAWYAEKEDELLRAERKLDERDERSREDGRGL